MEAYEQECVGEGLDAVKGKQLHSIDYTIINCLTSHFGATLSHFYRTSTVATHTGSSVRRCRCRAPSVRPCWPQLLLNQGSWERWWVGGCVRLLAARVCGFWRRVCNCLCACVCVCRVIRVCRWLAVCSWASSDVIVCLSRSSCCSCHITTTITLSHYHTSRVMMLTGTGWLSRWAHAQSNRYSCCWRVGVLVCVCLCATFRVRHVETHSFPLIPLSLCITHHRRVC